MRFNFELLPYHLIINAFEIDIVADRHICLYSQPLSVKHCMRELPGSVPLCNKPSSKLGSC